MHLQQQVVTEGGALERVNSTDKTVCCLFTRSRSVQWPPSIRTTLPGILAQVPWVLMSAERGEKRREGGRKGGRRGWRPERERGGGGVSGLFKALVLCLPLSTEEGEAHMHWGKHTCTHSSSSRIFTGCSPDWQQQTELRGSAIERGKQGRHPERRAKQRRLTQGFPLLPFGSLGPTKESPLCSSWVELALPEDLHPTMAALVGHGNPCPLSSDSSKLWTTFILGVLTLSTQVWGFNLDTTHTLHKLGDPGTFFGFSLALHQQRNPDPQSWWVWMRHWARPVCPVCFWLRSNMWCLVCAPASHTKAHREFILRDLKC